MSTPALIGLGSNLGDRKDQLDRAVAALRAAPGVRLLRVSSFHETTPVGGPGGQEPFLNAAALVNTDLTPHELLSLLHRIEAGQGRERSVRWRSRTLDLDLLVFGSRFLRTPELTLPHPRMAVRRFVLAPGAEIAPDLTHTPSRRSLRQLLERLDRRPALLALAGPPTPQKDEVLARLNAALPSSVVIRAQRPHLGTKGVSDGRSRSTLGLFDEALKLLDGRRRTNHGAGQSWLISDTCPTLDWGQRHGVPSPLISPDCPGSSRDAFDHCLKPTFAAVIDPTGAMRPEPWGPPHAVYWPEGRAVGEWVEEILAACRGAAGA